MHLYVTLTELDRETHNDSSERDVNLCWGDTLLLQSGAVRWTSVIFCSGSSPPTALFYGNKSVIDLQPSMDQRWMSTICLCRDRSTSEMTRVDTNSHPIQWNNQSHIEKICRWPLVNDISWYLTRTFVSKWECGIHFHSESQIQRSSPILHIHISPQTADRADTERFTGRFKIAKEEIILLRLVEAWTRCCGAHARAPAVCARERILPWCWFRTELIHLDESVRAELNSSLL